jgi:hypothetical protein
VGPGIYLFFSILQNGAFGKKFTKNKAKFVDSTLDKQNFPHFPTYFGRKMTPICQNKQTLVGTWDQSSSRAPHIGLICKFHSMDGVLAT